MARPLFPLLNKKRDGRDPRVKPYRIHTSFVRCALPFETLAAAA
jgi:hypothetical protein